MNNQKTFSPIDFHIMGILNVTPDSFSDGGKFLDPYRAVEHTRNMLLAGASIIDIGGESTRPPVYNGEAIKVSAEEEIKRIIPVLHALIHEFPNTLFSIDTSKAAVAAAALQEGASIVNDVWGLKKDPRMANVVAEHNATIILMHNQEDNVYHKDLMECIIEGLQGSIKLAKKAGIADDKIWLDPGFGFAKTAEQNIELLGRLHEIAELDYPIVLGTSRKITLSNILHLPAKELGVATAATTVLGMQAGATIFRVHDVKENYQAMKITEAVIERATALAAEF